MSGGIIINRVQIQLALIDDPAAAIYSQLSEEDKETVEQIRVKGSANWTQDDWYELLEICNHVS